MKMKKISKRILSALLAALMVITSIPLFALSASAESASDSLTAAIDNYLDAMNTVASTTDTKVYPDLSTAYAAYVAAQKQYDLLKFGDNDSTASSAASTLNSAVTTMLNSAVSYDEYMGTAVPTYTYCNTIDEYYYSNLLYSPIASTTNRPINDNTYQNFKISMYYAPHVMLYDGVNETSFPVVLNYVSSYTTLPCLYACYPSSVTMASASTGEEDLAEDAEAMTPSSVFVLAGAKTNTYSHRNWKAYHPTSSVSGTELTDCENATENISYPMGTNNNNVYPDDERLQLQYSGIWGMAINKVIYKGGASLTSTSTVLTPPSWTTVHSIGSDVYRRVYSGADHSSTFTVINYSKVREALASFGSVIAKYDLTNYGKGGLTDLFTAMDAISAVKPMDYFSSGDGTSSLVSAINDLESNQIPKLNYDYSEDSDFYQSLLNTLTDAMSNYESAMATVSKATDRVYTNLSTAYAAYVAVQKQYDSLKYGGVDNGAQAAATTLNNAVTSMLNTYSLFTSYMGTATPTFAKDSNTFSVTDSYYYSNLLYSPTATEDNRPMDDNTDVYWKISIYCSPNVMLYDGVNETSCPVLLNYTQTGSGTSGVYLGIYACYISSETLSSGSYNNSLSTSSSAINESSIFVMGGAKNTGYSHRNWKAYYKSGLSCLDFQLCADATSNLWYPMGMYNNGSFNYADNGECIKSQGSYWAPAVNKIVYKGDSSSTSTKKTYSPSWVVIRLKNSGNTYYQHHHGAANSFALTIIDYSKVRSALGSFGSTIAKYDLTDYSEGGFTNLFSAMDTISAVKPMSYFSSSTDGTSSLVSKIDTLTSTYVPKLSATYTTDSADYQTLRDTFDDDNGIVDTYKAGNDGVYTTDSWSNFTSKYVAAQKVMANVVSSGYSGTPKTASDNLIDAYNDLQKIADFSELDEQLNLKQDYYNAEFPLNADGTQMYSVSSWINFQTIYENAYNLADVAYGDETARNNAAGYTPGADSTTPTELQEEINDYAEQIKSNPEAPAQDEAYVAAKDLSDTIDLDSYKIAQNITDAISDGDTAIYTEYPEGSGTEYISVSLSDQSVVDNYTADLLTTMNVAKEDESTDTSNNGKFTTVIFQKNGVQTFTQEYGYGTQLSFPIVADSDTPSDTQVTKAQSKSLYITVTNDTGVTNTIPLSSDKTLKFVAQGTTITVNLQYDVAEAANVFVKDYFGTVLYSGTIDSEEDIVTNDEDATVTINDTVVSAKPSPAITFTGWEIVLRSNGTYAVTQVGTRIGDTHHFEATNGIVTKYNSTEPITALEGYGVAYTVAPNDGVTPIVWKMTVNEKEYLAAYESSFTRFAYDKDVIYTAITSEDELGDLSDAYGKPISYGDGFINSDNKFTLSCFYSQAPGTTITEAGVLYSTNGDLTSETMTKGAADVSTKIQTRVSDYNTYTMTKTNASTGTHLMRSYACYTVEEQGITVIRVAYGPVYKCEDGVVSIVES